MRNGGRQKGTPNKATVAHQARQAEIVASGLTPLEYMLGIMRDTNEPKNRRDDMAKAAAPFLHPRLQSVEMKADHTIHTIARKAMTPEAWALHHADMDEQPVQLNGGTIN